MLVTGIELEAALPRPSLEEGETEQALLHFKS